VPVEWETAKLASVADIQSGVTLNEDRKPRQNAFQYLTVINVQRGSINVAEPRFIELLPAETTTKLLDEDDILVVEGHANRADIGRAAMVTSQFVGLSFQNHLFRVRVTDENVNPKFLIAAMNSEYAKRHWSAVANTSSGLNTINRRQLRRLQVPIPKPYEQSLIVDEIAAIDQGIDSLTRKRESLERVKQALCQSMITGNVRLLGSQS
jgi:type I restriction enzyme S subunit